MNTHLQTLFSQGKAVEVLTGLGKYFTPDVTYRNEHDFILVVGELLEWARTGHYDDAAIAFGSASTTLLKTGRFEDALRLVRSYFILRKEMQITLPLDESHLAATFDSAVQNAAEQLSRNENLRNLLLLVTQDFPQLRARIGMS
jgi:hypothetical protein